MIATSAMYININKFKISSQFKAISNLLIASFMIILFHKGVKNYD